MLTGSARSSSLWALPSGTSYLAGMSDYHTSYELPLIAEDCMAYDLPDCNEDDGEETEEEGEEGPMD